MRTDSVSANNDGQMMSPSMIGALNGSAPLQNGKDKAPMRRSSVSHSVSVAHSNHQSNGHRESYYGHDREEVTRLLIQALSDLGYDEAAANVSESSGYALESQAVAEFRRAVLAGQWEEAERLLLGASTDTVDEVTGTSTAAGSTDDLSIGAARPAASLNGQALSIAPNGLVLVPGADRSLMRFGIRQQKYLEYLEQCDTAKALHVLRHELTPLYQDKQRLHFLSSLLMCHSKIDLMSRTRWDGALGQSRPHLLSELSRFISPSVMLPEHRLAVLLRQIKDVQVSRCVFHTNAAQPSLYADHVCSKNDFPSYLLHEIDSNSGEIWQIRFSGNGKYLAACGSGRYVHVYDVSTFKLKMRLDGHVQGAGDIAWSPNDDYLVSCGRDGKGRLWDMNTGLLIHMYEEIDEPVSSVAWVHDGKSIIMGSFERERSLCEWSVTGERLHTFSRKNRTESLVLSPDNAWLVAMNHDQHLHVYNFYTKELEYDMALDSRAVSVAISADSQFLLVMRQDGELQMYNIQARGEPVHTYTGATVGNCVVRSSFGGADESFVVSGGEDGNLNIWHKNLGVHLFRLEAHKPRCNAVVWSPTDNLLASCGDDGKIKFWSSSERVRQREAEAAQSNGASSRGSNGWRPELSSA